MRTAGKSRKVRVARAAVIGLLAGVTILGSAGVALAVQPVTENACLTALAAPLIANLGVTGVSIGTDQLPSGAMAQVDMLSPNVIRISPEVATWCGTDGNDQLKATISHELGHVMQFRLAGDPGRSAILRHRLEPIFGTGGDVLEDAADCEAKIQLDVDISRFARPGCTPAMLAATQAIADGVQP
jgi:hypothetical protein